MAAEYSPQRIADRLEIQDRVARFSRGVDRKDWELASSVYHRGAIDHHGIYDGDVVEFMEFTKRRHETVLLSMHHTGNILIDFLGANDALVETYCLAWQALASDNKDMRAAIDGQGSARHRGGGDGLNQELVGPRMKLCALAQPASEELEVALSQQ